MTAAPVITDIIEAVEDPEADWAVVLRLMHWRDVGPTLPTAADLHLAVWLLLDLGHEPVDIRKRLGVDKPMVQRVSRLRALAADPPVRKSRRGLPAVDYRQYAPTEWERRLLGVPGPVTRP